MKQGLSRLGNFLIYSNVFIAACAALMVSETNYLFLDQPASRAILFFTFFATICSYSFHWYLTPIVDTTGSRVTWLKRYRFLHGILFLLSIPFAAWFGLVLIEHWPWILLAVFMTFLYSAPMVPHPWFRLLRKIALGKTIFLAMVWTYVTAALPLLVSGKAWQTEYSLFISSRFFLIYAICILFDLRDRNHDRRIGIRSLITWLNSRQVMALFITSLLIFTIASLLLGFYGQSLLHILILLIPGILTLLLSKRAMKQPTDGLYYFILDGLMALSAFLFLIERLNKM